MNCCKRRFPLCRPPPPPPPPRDSNILTNNVFSFNLPYLRVILQIRHKAIFTLYRINDNLNAPKTISDGPSVQSQLCRYSMILVQESLLVQSICLTLQRCHRSAIWSQRCSFFVYSVLSNKHEKVQPVNHQQKCLINRICGTFDIKSDCFGPAIPRS